MIDQENKRLETLVENILQNSTLDRKDLIWEGGPIEIVALTSVLINNARFRVDTKACDIKFEKKILCILLLNKELKTNTMNIHDLDISIFLQQFTQFGDVDIHASPIKIIIISPNCTKRSLPI